MERRDKRPGRPPLGGATRATVLGLLVAVGIGGCRTGSAAKDPFGGDRGMNQIRIEVRSLNWNDATLYALSGGERRRIGVVPSMGEEEFVFDWRMSDVLRIEIDLLAGDRCVTREMMVDPGDRIYLQIESDLSRDPECIRRGRQIIGSP